MGRPEAVQTALINRRFAAAISRQVLADDPEGRHNWLTNVAAARVPVGDENPMTLVLMAVGLLVAAAGLVTIGFGIPINAFSLGNTLIVSGTIAVVERHDPDRPGAGARPVAADRRGAQSKPLRAPNRPNRSPPRPPAPPRRPHAVAPTLLCEPLGGRAAAAPEPSAPPEPRCARAPFPRHRQRAAARSAGLAAREIQAGHYADPGRTGAAVRCTEPPMVELTDEAPLSPRSPQRPAMPPAIEPARAEGLAAEPRFAATPACAPNSRCRAPLRRSSRRRKRNGSIWCGPIAAPRCAARAGTGRAPRSRPSASLRSTCRCRRFRHGRAKRGRPPRGAMPELPAQARSRTRTGDPEVRRDRRHALYALRRRLDRSAIAAGHGEIRLGRCVARAPRKAKLTADELDGS